MKVVFLGGLFPDEQRVFIEENSKGVIQNAADALQWSLFRGALDVLGDDVSYINLPFVGSYPKRAKSLFFPGGRFSVKGGGEVLGLPFINVTGVKLFSRLLSSIRGLIKSKLISGIIIVYSAHTPFMIASILYRMLFKDVKLCLVIPDLPEYMGGKGLLYSVFKQIDILLFYFLVRKFDYYVLLTKQMGEKLKLNKDRVVIVEGIASAFRGSQDFTGKIDSYPLGDELDRVFLYSGTLARRYGILHLLEAFSLLQIQSCSLLICGDGDARDDVVYAARKDNRIHYLGQLSRGDVRVLQEKVFCLINPRMDDGEYTKYSFPSKIMEYMSSGRPVIMYHLPGIPGDYIGYFFSPADGSARSLADCMRRVAELSNSVADQFGKAARDFVVENKNERSQFLKIFKLFNGEKNA